MTVMAALGLLRVGFADPFEPKCQESTSYLVRKPAWIID
jgi:hypothetical protein